MSNTSHQRLAEWAALLDEELPEEYAVTDEKTYSLIQSGRENV
jgi:hypothetical protein